VRPLFPASREQSSAGRADSAARDHQCPICQCQPVPASCRVVTLRRLQALIAAVPITSAVSSRLVVVTSGLGPDLVGTGSARSLRRGRGLGELERGARQALEACEHDGQRGRDAEGFVPAWLGLPWCEADDALQDPRLRLCSRPDPVPAHSRADGLTTRCLAAVWQ
jgi:hypothetical protein